MDNVNKTLYIPLYGKSYVSKKGIVLKDKKQRKSGKRKNSLLKESLHQNGLPIIWVCVLPYLISG